MQDMILDNIGFVPSFLKPKQETEIQPELQFGTNSVEDEESAQANDLPNFGK